MNNWTDKSEQEKAEWLAENVLGYKAFKGFPELLANDDANPSRLLLSRPKESSIKNVCDFIYSPDGFFAVWDVVASMPHYFCIHFGDNIKMDKMLCKIQFYRGSIHHRGEGKDRYEAFYSAVYEAMNEKINTNS